MQIATEIQTHWNNGSLLGINSILLNNGKVKHLDISSKRKELCRKTYGSYFVLSMGKVSTLRDLLEEDNDLWSEIQINGEILLTDSSKLLFGEGEMGGDGFIVKLDSEGLFVWSFYSAESNPFINYDTINDKIHIFSSHGFSIVIDPNNPFSAYIDNHE